MINEPALIQRNIVNAKPTNPRLSWKIPLIGYALTFLLGAGLSASNKNIRTEVEIVGVAVFLIFSAWGFAYTGLVVREWRNLQWMQWRKHVIFGLLCNVALTWLFASLAYASYVAKHLSFPARTYEDHRQVTAPGPMSAPKVPVWIDTDPACGTAKTADVDDCWALLMAVRCPELRIQGISTVFGNQPGGNAVEFLRNILPQLEEAHWRGRGHLQVYPGSVTESDGRWRVSEAAEAMARSLEDTPMTIMTLGPATNVATLIRTHLDLTNKIERIIFVAGKRPGALFHPGTQWWFHFGDFNVSHDTPATRAVLYSGVPITLIPFELATQLTITAADLDRLRSGDKPARWLAEVSQEWLSFWKTSLGKEGFNPFDVLAIGYVVMPDYFHCRRTQARIGFNLFLDLFGVGRDLEVGDQLRGVTVTYCFDVTTGFKDKLLERLRN